MEHDKSASCSHRQVRWSNLHRVAAVSNGTTASRAHFWTKRTNSGGCGWPACSLAFATFQELLRSLCSGAPPNSSGSSKLHHFVQGIESTIDNRCTRSHSVHACERIPAQYAMSAESRVGHACFCLRHDSRHQSCGNITSQYSMLIT